LEVVLPPFKASQCSIVDFEMSQVRRKGSLKKAGKPFRNPFVRRGGGSVLSPRQLRRYHIGKLIGKGAYGKVFRATKSRALPQQNVNVAIKMVDTGSSEDGYRQFMMERWTTELLHVDGGIGPKFHDGWCIRKDHKTLGIIVMELWDCTLGEYMEQTGRKGIPKLVIDKVQQQLDRLHNHYRLAHMDVHGGNIMVKLGSDKNTIVDATLVDFGNAVHLDGVDQEIMQQTIDHNDLPRTIKDPRRIDHCMFSKMKKEWK
jgi:serine/threonine protein kinase